MSNALAISPEQEVLFNFKWTRHRVQQLHQLSKHRGITASAIIKSFLIEQFRIDGIDPTYFNTTSGGRDD